MACVHGCFITKPGNCDGYLFLSQMCKTGWRNCRVTTMLIILHEVRLTFHSFPLHVPIQHSLLETSILLVASKSVDGTETLPLVQALLWVVNELNVISFYRFNSEERLLIQIPVDRWRKQVHVALSHWPSSPIFEPTVLASHRTKLPMVLSACVCVTRQQPDPRPLQSPHTRP